MLYLLHIYFDHLDKDQRHGILENFYLNNKLKIFLKIGNYNEF